MGISILTTYRFTMWYCVCLHHLALCFNASLLPDSSSLSSTPHFLYITSKVGNQVVLPCSWKPRLGDMTLSVCHVQWTNPIDTVFEQQGELTWQAEGFEGRVEVPEEKLGSGDCSLIIRDVQIGDTGSYDSFMLVDRARSKKSRVFIQSVRLSVTGEFVLSCPETSLEMYVSTWASLSPMSCCFWTRVFHVPSIFPRLISSVFTS